MSILDDVMKEEHDRIRRVVCNIEDEINGLPKGYISEKKIKGNIYYYLQHRENKKVKSTYIKKDEIDVYRTLISHRKELELQLKKMKNELKKLERVLK